MKDWTAAFEKSLNTLKGRSPEEVINEIVDIGLSVEEESAAILLERHSELDDYRIILTEVYNRYILAMEGAEVEQLISLRPEGSNLFSDIAGEAAMMAYNRVGDMFDHVNFDHCKRFVLIGCGQLPMTALHVNDRTNVPEIICIDVTSEAISAVQKLTASLGGLRLQAMKCDGQIYDFSLADVVYVANMVSPKAGVVSRIIETASEDVQIIVREPYSLGLLWAESIEMQLDSQLEVVGRGRGSRYLSRDIYLQRRQSSGVNQAGC